MSAEKEIFNTSPLYSMIRIVATPDEKQMPGCRWKISPPPLFLPRLPHVPVFVPPRNNFNCLTLCSPYNLYVKYPHLGWPLSQNPSSAPEVRKIDWMISQQKTLHSAGGSHNIRSGYSRSVLIHTGVALLELRSLLKPIFRSELSTSKTAPNTARPPPTAPEAKNSGSCQPIWNQRHFRHLGQTRYSPNPYTKLLIRCGLISNSIVVGLFYLSEIIDACNNNVCALRIEGFISYIVNRSQWFQQRELRSKRDSTEDIYSELFPTTRV